MAEHKSVLVIEDDYELLFTLTEEFKLYGYNCFGVDGVEDAQQKINQDKFDLIVLDITLQSEHGLKIIDAVRSDSQNPNYSTPILLHSGGLNKNILSRYQNQIDDALVKPVSGEIWKKKLSFWCNRTHKHAS